MCVYLLSWSKEIRASRRINRQNKPIKRDKCRYYYLFLVGRESELTFSGLKGEVGTKLCIKIACLKNKTKKKWNKCVMPGYTAKLHKSNQKNTTVLPSSSASRRSCDSHSGLPGSLPYRWGLCRSRRCSLRSPRLLPFAFKINSLALSFLYQSWEIESALTLTFLRTTYLITDQGLDNGRRKDKPWRTASSNPSGN